jgi:excisionase family DNA binding protein
MDFLRNTSPEPTLNMITTPEVAAHLHVSVWMVRKLVAEGKLPVVTIGRGYLFDPRDLDEFIQKSKVLFPRRSKHKK